MYFPPILHYLLYYFKHIGKHMTKSESARTENMYNFANQHQQDTNIKKLIQYNLSETIVTFDICPRACSTCFMQRREVDLDRD